MHILKKNNMNFGNWLITEKGISWNGSAVQKFEIPVSEINTTRNIDGTELYEWILIGTDQHWLTQNDLYDLNYAFVYTVAKLNLPFNYEVFDATLEEQYDQFDDEEEDEDQ
jgi:hypothetical protein